jgi:hypothetical protein
LYIVKSSVRAAKDYPFGEREEKAKEYIHQGGSAPNPGDQESGSHEVHPLSDTHPPLAVSKSQGRIAYRMIDSLGMHA